MSLLEMSRQNIIFGSCCRILLQCLSRFHFAKTLVNKNGKGGVLFQRECGLGEDSKMCWVLGGKFPSS